MEFKQRTSALSIAELAELVKVSPSHKTLREGFNLQDPEVNDLLQAANDIASSLVYLREDDTNSTSIDVLQKAVVVLQLGLDVATRDNEALTNDYNTLQQDLQDVEQENAVLQEENEALRERQDLRGPTGDIAGINNLQQDLQQKLSQRDERIESLLERQEKDATRLQELESRLHEADEEARRYAMEAEQLKADLQGIQMHARELDSQLASQARLDNRRELQDNIKQHEWKIERLTKDNRALAAANTELRSKMEELKGENLQVSERIVGMAEENRSLQLREAELDGKLEMQLAENAQLLDKQAELYGEVQDKLSLLEAFEDKFTRQYRSWEEERTSLQAHIEQLKKENRNGTFKATRTGPNSDSGPAADGPDVTDDELADLRLQLEEAQDKELLLLEAYEQLEKDVGKEVDRALSHQREEFERLRRRTEFLEQHLQNERAKSHELKEQFALLEQELQGAMQHNNEYEQGIYGLPQATMEIKQLKQGLHEVERLNKDLTQQLSSVTGKVEDLYDENTELRKKCGLTNEDRVDIAQLKQQRETLVMQLRGVNTMLECQVADLEEERRKLRMELKFRAKYHGQHALEMGLTPEQLLLVEQYVEELKYGRSPEGNVVTQLQKRIEFLEIRLAEVMAFADIPPSIRPLLERDSGISLLQAASSPAAATQAAHANAAAQALLEALAALKAVQVKIANDHKEGRKEYQDAISSVMGQLNEVETLVQSLSLFASSSSSLLSGQTPKPHDVHPTDPSGAAAAASSAPAHVSDIGELSKQLVELAKTVVDLQKQLAAKDVQLRKAMATPAVSVTTSQLPSAAQSMELQAARLQALSTLPAQQGSTEDIKLLKGLLVEHMEQVVTREQELCEARDACARYQSKMQAVTDQVKLLYRDYANAVGRWKVERTTLQKRGKRLQEDADGYKAANAELERGMEAIQSGSGDKLQSEFADAVRRTAIVQIKHARIARQLEASAMSEKALQDRIVELEQELQDVASTCRARVAWLEASVSEASRRNEQLLLELQCSAPLQAYQELLKKHTQLVTKHRGLVEEKAQDICSSDEMHLLRQEVVDITMHYLKAAGTNAALQAKVQQLELAVDGKISLQDLHSIQLKELVAARVDLETSATRAQLADREKQRIQQTLSESQDRTRDLESRVAKVSAELAATRAELLGLKQATEGGKTAQEVKTLLDRLHSAEQLAVSRTTEVAEQTAAAEDSKAQLREAQKKLTLQLAQAANLRAAMREMMASNDHTAALGKLHLELEHVREKEALMRGALNRSELERLDLEKQVRELRELLVKTQGKASVLQEQTKWADEQRKKAQAQLQVEVAERVEGWKARQWARKLDQLQGQNAQQFKALADARGKILELEQAVAAELLHKEASAEQHAMLRKPASQVHSEAVRLREQLLQQKLEASSTERKSLMMNEQVLYLEKVTQELQSMLTRYEQEELKERHTLEQQRQEATAQVAALQEQVATLHTRLNSVTAEADARIMAARAAARNAIAAAGGASLLQTQVPADAYVTDSLVMEVARDAPRMKAFVQNMAASDREVMLRQIETLKKAREEAEYLRHEANDLKAELSKKQQALDQLQVMYDDVLERLSQQTQAQLALYSVPPTQQDAGEVALSAMRSMAQATVQELQTKIKDRDAQIAALEGNMGHQQEDFAMEREQLRNAVKELKQRMLDLENLQIGQARDEMETALKRIGLKGNGKEEVPYDELKRLLAEQAAEAQRAAAVVMQKDNMILVLEKNLELQAKRHEQDIQRVKEEAERARADASNPKYLVQKLKSQLNAKDEKMRQLKEAIKQLEQKLVKKMKEAADIEMHKASWHDQEDLDERIKQLEKERKALIGKVEAAREEASDLKQQVKQQDDKLKQAVKDLQREVDSNSQLRSDLSKERATLQRLRTAQEQVVDLTSGMSVDATRQLERMQNRVHVLEKQNDVLKQKLEAERDTAAAATAAAHIAQPGTGKRNAANRSRSSTSKSVETTRSAGTPDAKLQDDDDVSSSGGDRPTTSPAALSSTKLWEQQKRLSMQLDRANKRLAKKDQDFTELQKAAATRDTVLAALRNKVEEQETLIKQLQKQPKLNADVQNLRHYAMLVVELEEEVSNLQSELAVVRQQLQTPAQKTATAAPATTDITKNAAEELSAASIQLFELQLQRDNAQAQVQRMHQHLVTLFGPNAEGATFKYSDAGCTGRRKPGPVVNAQREAELLSTINSLKIALEKSTASTVPMSKYIQELAKKKELQRQFADTQKQLQETKCQVNALDRRCADLQVGSSELRQQLGQALEEGRRGLPPGAATRLAALEQIVTQKDTELQILRKTLLHKEQELSGMSTAGNNGSGTGEAIDSATLKQLEARIARLEAENADLHNELDAFDPEFFEEIEDLKHEHHQLSQQCAQYEQQIQQLTQQVATT